MHNFVLTYIMLHCSNIPNADPKASDATHIYAPFIRGQRDKETPLKLALVVGGQARVGADGWDWASG